MYPAFMIEIIELKGLIKTKINIAKAEILKIMYRADFEERNFKLKILQ